MTRFGTYLFSIGTHRGNLLVNSRFSTGDLNFCVHSIPLWEPCVEKRVMLRASVALEEHCSNYIMSMLNLQIHPLWPASSQQHECGISQNKLSESILPSVMCGWVTTFVCTSICQVVPPPPPPPPPHTHTPRYACMSLWIKSVFSPDTSAYMHVRVYE